MLSTSQHSRSQTPSTIIRYSVLHYLSYTHLTLNPSHIQLQYLTYLTHTEHAIHSSIPCIHYYPQKHQPTITIRTIIYWHRSDITSISNPYQHWYQQRNNIIIIPIRRPLIHTTHRATVYILNHNPCLSYPMLYKPISTFDYPSRWFR